MFTNLSSRLTQTINNLLGRGRLTSENIKETLDQIKTALLEADVALPVVEQFVKHVEIKALGAEVVNSLKPGEVLVKIVHDELVTTLGKSESTLNLKTQKPAVIMVVGLQGSGKTTTVAKLSHWLKEKEKKSITLASTDIYRPAAIEQLEILAQQISVPFYKTSTNEDPIAIAKNAIQITKQNFSDILILDTAGRLHIDDEMMQELAAIQNAANPIETLLVVDSMTGQDAANIAKTFNEKITVTGVILTKTDGDARGGAALSMRFITEKPIKFIGTGENIAALEPFYPDRIASRILDMGDIVSLVEDVQHKIDQKKAEKFAKKIAKGAGFDFEDFKEQLQQMRNMGGLKNIIAKLPGIGQLNPAAANLADDKMLVKMEAIIDSMTIRERRFPAIIKGSHRKRIASGSGTQVQDVNRLIKQFENMQRMMKRFKRGGGMLNMMKNMQM